MRSAVYHWWVRSQTLGDDEPGLLVVCRCAELGDTNGKVVRLI